MPQKDAKAKRIATVKSKSFKCGGSCVESAAKLLKMGAEIDIVDSRGYTPLCLAAIVGNVRMVKMLAKHGANVNHRINRGFSPLYLAASKLKREIVIALREFNADVTFCDLVEASTRKNVLKLLIEAGANLSAKDTSGRTLLHWAAWEGNKDAAEWLISERAVDIDELDADNWTPLHYAVRDGHIDVAQKLLDCGACPSIRDRWGDTPLCIAQFWKHSALCQALISVGAAEEE